MAHKKQRPGAGATARGPRDASSLNNAAPGTEAQAKPQAAPKRGDIRTLTETAHGVFEQWLVTPADLQGLARADAGPHGQAVLGGVGNWLRHALGASPGPLCLTCDTEFGRRTERLPAAWSVLVPFADPVGVIVTGICASCAGRDDLQARMLESHRRVWPDLTVTVEKGAWS